MEQKKTKKYRLTYTQIIALGFFLIIALGTFLLCLPVSSADGHWTPVQDALFTATSATCVTGLVVYNTAVYWSLFGQIVILVLIQIGGLGLMTLITLMSMLLNRQISLQERRLLMQSAGNIQLSGIVRLVKKVALLTLLFEGVGFLLLAVRFCRQYTLGKGLYLALFHSVSAFCNAGFDLFGQFGQSSLCSYVDDPYVMAILIFLIVTGGLGFLVWDDMFKCRLRFRKYHLHSKLVLTTSGFLILAGTALFFITEKHASMEGLGVWRRLLASLFQSVTTRTAGFNTVDQAALSDAGSLASVFLMLIGGSPGSTAGGVKTTTIAVVLASTFYAGRNVGHVQMFKRRISEDTVRQAAAVVNVYLIAVFVSAMLICFLESVSLRESLFEVSSAIGTVGLTMGMTPALHTLSKLILIVLMFAGRLGGLSLVLVFAEKRNKVQLERPVEKILIG